MVDLKPLHAESFPELRTLLKRHLEYTESPLAKRLLDRWPEAANGFVRVMPRDYARVLREQRRDRAEEVAHGA